MGIGNLEITREETTNNWIHKLTQSAFATDWQLQIQVTGSMPSIVKQLPQGRHLQFLMALSNKAAVCVHDN